MKNKQLFEQPNHRLTAIGRYNDRQGNREIFDRQFGRAHSTDFILRFDEMMSVDTMRPLMPLEIIEEVQKRVAELPEKFFFSPVEFFTENYRVRIHDIIKK